ncbi:hypothetical protein G6L37_02785 [Agrobacterium rubi]|nr:hypothetical protein [Agrobacterium rubi]NTF24307.1 hypothetical protein [Agrobacterium rubi]
MFAAQKSDLADWLASGAEKGATHMVVVLDGWDQENYPVYVMPGENAREVADKYAHKEMQRVVEVYDLAVDYEQQLGQRRVMNF